MWKLKNDYPIIKKMEESLNKEKMPLVSVSDSFFFEMPQERDIEGEIDFFKKGQKHKAALVYSIPCERCEGCPMYNVDKSTTPTSYYCQSKFLIGGYKIARQNKEIPENCKVYERYTFNNR